MSFKLIPSRPLLFAVAVAVGLGSAVTPAAGQWVRGSEQFYLPASHNWVFRHNFIGADRLFNAFDYGHAILYETLYRYPNGPVERLEEREYVKLTEEILKRPPRVALEEGAVEIAYAKLAPEAKLMFEWAHVFHRQAYDILADERLTEAGKDSEMAALLAYYRSRPDLAFSTVPKSMDIMDGQHYSLAFREAYPKFNGLIWAYHWLQVGLYEPLLVNTDVASRTAGVTATVGRFWQMLEQAPTTMPHLMPMTAGIAPTFAERYPEAAIIFDNLHMMHDVISDILASPEVPRNRKRAEILRAAEMFRDDTSYAISFDEWAMMGEMMGIHNMGGPAVGFTAALPQPTVPLGMSLAGMDHAGHDQAASAEAGHEGHAAGQVMPDGAGAPDSMMSHDRMGMMSQEHMGMMHEMHMRMMEDPEIRARLEADPAMRGMMEEMHASMMSGTSPDASPDAPRPEAHQLRAFILRLLADPEIERRIHSTPELHELWSDPQIQQMLGSAEEPASPTAPGTPTPEPAVGGGSEQPHQHD